MRKVHDICRDETNRDDSDSEIDVDDEVDFLEKNGFSILFDDE